MFPCRRALLFALILIPCLPGLAVTISPTTLTLQEAAKQQFTASVASSWQTTCGVISATGLYTASLYANSGCTVTATANNGSGVATATIVITSPITMTPVVANTVQGQTQQFTASMPVTWSAACGSLSTSGLFTATAAPGTSCTVSGIATGSVKYTVYGRDVSTAPVYAKLTISALGPTLNEGASQQLTTSIAATFSTTCGTITAAGLYTAPLLPTSCTVTAKATDGSGHTASTIGTIKSPITISPASATTVAGKTQLFAASSTVTWATSCGSISSAGMFTAPATPGACSIVATASTGTAYTANSVDTVTAAALTISPASPKLSEGAAQQFSSSAPATWVASCGAINPNTGAYTAPLVSGSCTVTATATDGSDHVASTTATVSTPIVISPAAATTAQGQTQQFTANVAVSWAASCGSISSAGLFTASTTQGSACSVTATAATGTAYTASVVDTIGAAPTLTISPLSPTLSEGAVQQFSSSVPATWSASCGTIDPNAGTYTAPLAPGACTVTATANDGSGHVAATTATIPSPLAITPATATTGQAQTQQFTANAAVTWATSCGSINANGLFIASASQGSACTITATAASGQPFTATAQDTIGAAPAFTLSPLSPVLSAKGTQQFTTSLPASFSASCGSIDPSGGLYTAPLGAASCTITATNLNNSAQTTSTTATVTASLVITPATATTSAELTQQFTANMPATWQSSCGTVNANGLFTAPASQGSVCTVTATASTGPAYTGTAADSIAASPALIILPATPSLSEGSSLQFTSDIPVTFSASCGTIDPNLGTYLAPLSAETCTVTASASDGSGNSASTAAAITSPLVITPATATTAQSGTQQFTSSAPSTWTASCGSIDSTGNFTATAVAGSICQIMATASSGTPYTSTALDTIGQQTALTISPANPSLNQAGTQQFTSNLPATFAASCGSIDPNAGLYTAPLTSGTCTATATSTDATAQVVSTIVTVTSPLVIQPLTATTSPGATQQFSANLPANWAASCGAVDSTGLFTASAPSGSACTITATATSGPAYTALVSDTVAAPAVLSMTPSSVSLIENAQQQFSANVPVVFSATCGSIDPNSGLYTAPLSAGTCIITATPLSGSGAAASASASITSPIIVSPASATTAQGQTQQFTANAAVNWAASCGSIASTGLFAASTTQGTACSVIATAATGVAYIASVVDTIGAPLVPRTYYVDSVAGLDTNDGMTAAWQTIAKVNKSAFHAGDSILFNRGGTWYDKLIVPSTGTQGYPVTIGAYGSGAQPIIDGSSIFSTWTTDTTTAPSSYYSPYTTATNSVWFDATLLAQVTSKASLAPGTWWLDTADHRIYLNDNPSGHIITASQRANCIYSLQNHNTVQDIACQKALTVGIALLGTNNIVQRTTVSQMIMNDNTGQGYGISIHGNNSVAQNNTVHDVGWGIQASAGSGLILNGAVVQYNTLYNIGGDGVTGWSAATGVFQNVVLQYNLVYNASQYGAVLGTAGGLAFVGANTTTQTASGNVIQYNITYGNGNATNIGCGIHVDQNVKNSSVLYNVVYGNYGYGIGVFANGSTTIANNTIYNDLNGTHGVAEVQINSAAGTSSAVFENNIIEAAGTGLLLKIPAGSTAHQLLDHNVWFGGSSAPFQWASTAYTFAAYETATGQDTHSMISDPKFIATSATAPNLALQSSSPAIDTGLNLGATNPLGLDGSSTWPGGVLLDNENTYGAGWEAGAYVFATQSATNAKASGAIAQSSVVPQNAVATSLSVTPPDIDRALENVLPRVVSITPEDGAAGMGLDSQVVITFSASMSPAQWLNGGISLLARGKSLPYHLSTSADNRSVVLSVSSLSPSSKVTVHVPGSLQDLSGNHLAAEYTSTFTAAGAFASTGPSVVNQRPGNGATSVARSASSVTLFWNRPMRVSSLEEALHVKENGHLLAGSLSVEDDSKTMAFTPWSPWQPGALIEVSVDASAEDMNGSPAVVYQGAFTVADDPATTAAALVNFNPQPFAYLEEHAGTAPLEPFIELGYSEPLEPSTVDAANVEIDDGDGNLVPASVMLDETRTVIRLTPSSPLASSAKYSFHARNIQGVNGLTAEKRGVNFTTGEGAQATASAITAAVPADGLANVPVNTDMRISFSEPVDPLTVTSMTITLSAGGEASIPASIQFTDNNKTIEITPQAPLQPSTLMTVTVTGVADLTGHFVAPQTIRFTTGSGSGEDLSQARPIGHHP